MVQELLHNLQNDLRLGIFANWEKLENCQIRVETQGSAHSSSKIINVDNICEKSRKIRYYIFELLSRFTGFFYFLGNVFPRIVWRNKFLAVSWPSLFHTWISEYFPELQSVSPVTMKIKKQVSYTKSSKFNGFMLALFCILGVGQNSTLKNFQLFWLVVFWTNYYFWARIGTFPRKLNRHWTSRD